MWTIVASDLSLPKTMQGYLSAEKIIKSQDCIVIMKSDTKVNNYIAGYNYYIVEQCKNGNLIDKGYGLFVKN